MISLARNLLIALALLWAIPADAANRFLVLCTTACTWDNTNDAIWSTTSGGTNDATHPVAGDVVTLDANSCVGGLTCTITGGAVTIAATSITMGACTASTTGCIVDFSANNTNITVGTFSASGSGTRNLKMGNGTWTITGTGTCWNIQTITNLTFTANSSTILFSATSSASRTMIPGALTYSTISVAANSSLGSFSFATSTFTMGTLNVSAPNFIQFAAAVTTTITNAFNINGSSLTSLISFFSSNTTSAATISSANSGTFTYTAFRTLTFTGGGTFSATNSIDLGLNTGITITAPSTGGGRCIGC